MNNLPGTQYQDQSEIDVQLDLIYHMWDLPQYNDFWQTESAKALERHQPIEDIRIGARDEERVDVFKSAKPNSPIVVFIHGGWWMMCTRKFFSCVAQGFVERGYTVVISDYALCPKVGIPDITNASRAAVAWAYENAESINGDRERIFVTGHSAGGHQTAMVSITDWHQYGLPADVVKGAAPISGVFDIRPFQYSWIQPKLQLTSAIALQESPLFHIPAHGPPQLVILGEEESVEFHTQSENFVRAWRDAGMEAQYFDAPYGDHQTNMQMLLDPDSELVVMMDEFYRNC
ncbi:alpha/beta hydrolase [Gordonia sp. LSe1-13]|uniref:Alpha/beta hydrolase n=1 Tax=Gordonia sesuvii TaxID=3116777 RepID=A0ABU7MIU5_9ACTN|nr:alpha/beta hydrolase [Gordonia sp. LSe1-13]